MNTEPPQGVYRVLREPIQREILKHRAADLIREARDVDTVVFLDKSARPFTRFFQDLWPKFYSHKPLPKILTMDIGNEKGVVLSDHAAEQKWDRILIENLIPKLDSQQRLRQIYGDENIDRLQLLLRSDKPENRIIVDDLSHSGRTIKLVKHLMWLLDPVNKYKFFSFIEKHNLSAFHNPNMGWKTPWKLDEKPDDAIDPKSFIVSPAMDKRLNRQTQLRKELQMLAGEVNPST